MSDNEVNEVQPTKVDRRKITSKANMRKALEAKAQNRKKQKELREKYKLDDEFDSSSESEEEIIYKPVRNRKLVKRNRYDDDDYEDDEYDEPVIKQPKKPLKKPIKKNEDDVLKKEIDEMKHVLYTLALNSNKPKKRVKKIIVEKEKDEEPRKIPKREIEDSLKYQILKF